MIIKLDASFILSVKDGFDNNSSLFVSDLCFSLSRGDVVINNNKKDILELLRSKGIDKNFSSILKQILRSITFDRDLISEFSHVVVFYNSDYLDGKCDPCCDYRFDVKKYFSIADQGVKPLEFPALVVENLNDRKVYKKIAYDYSLDKPLLRGRKLGVNFYNGGGDTSSDVCKELIDDGKIVFCLVDSDMKFPGDTYRSETARKVIRIFSSVDKKASFLIINANEVENLIPVNVLIETARGSEQTASAKFALYVSEKYSEAYRYLDFKKGFSYEKVFSTDDYSGFWKPIIQSYECDVLKCNIDKAKEAGCKGVILPKLKSMLPHAIRNLEECPELTSIPVELKSEWERVGKQLFQWGFTGRPILVT